MLIQLARGAADFEETRPLRGGIDIAPGAVVGPDRFLYSAALSRAYKLESRAVYPRTVIGERVEQFLQSVIANPDQSPAAQYARALAIGIEEMIVTDADGVRILDFYGPAMLQAFGDGVAPGLGQQAWEYATKAAADAHARDDKKLIAKYDWLLEYMRPRRRLWE
jgi:hypothetical protein